VKTKVISRPKARSPVLVCGLPGSGLVGKLAADHLVRELKAKKVAEYSEESFPPQVNVSDEGIATTMKGELFYAKTGGPHDLFIFTADAQPGSSEGEYRLSDAVVAHCKALGVKSLYTLAAYVTGSFAEAPKVHGAGTSDAVVRALAANDVALMKDGGISGMNGVLVGIAGLRGVGGACLLGETSGYVVDAGASKAVLERLAKLVGFKVDTRSLSEKAEETKKLITQLQSMAEQGSETVPQPRKEKQPGYIS
jgi:uncharacterized protein